MIKAVKHAEKLKTLHSGHPNTYHLDAAIVTILLYLLYPTPILPAIHLPLHLFILFSMHLKKQVANVSTLQILSLVNAEC